MHLLLRFISRICTDFKADTRTISLVKSFIFLMCIKCILLRCLVNWRNTARKRIDERKTMKSFQDDLMNKKVSKHVIFPLRGNCFRSVKETRFQSIKNISYKLTRRWSGPFILWRSRGSQYHFLSGSSHVLQVAGSVTARL